VSTGTQGAEGGGPTPSFGSINTGQSFGSFTRTVLFGHVCNTSAGGDGGEGSTTPSGDGGGGVGVTTPDGDGEGSGARPDARGDGLAAEAARGEAATVRT